MCFSDTGRAQAKEMHSVFYFIYFFEIGDSGVRGSSVLDGCLQGQNVWFHRQHHFFKKGQTQEKKNPLYTREGRGLRGHAKDKHSLDTVLYLPFN